MASKITVYSKPDCVQCTATYRALDKSGAVKGVDYDVVDISVDAEARAFVLGLGYQQAPVVFAGGEHWSGFNKDKVRAAAATAVAERESVLAAA